MSKDFQTERTFRMLGAAGRRRHRHILAWRAAAAAAAVSLLLLAGEGVIGPAGHARAAVYLAAMAAALAAGVALARRWLVPAPEPARVARLIERLFPQARGALQDTLAAPAEGLAAARALTGRAWLARRGSARLGDALAADDRLAIERCRRLTLLLLCLTAAVAVGQPAAARRVAAALRGPSTLFWREGTTSWSVAPGDTTVAYGDSVTGRARFSGSAADGPLILEFRGAAGSWRAETLATGPAGKWSLPPVEDDVRYRFRFGPFRSPAYRIGVEAPLALARVEVRRPGSTWAPLVDSVVPAEVTVEFRGVATRPLAGASVRVGGAGEFPLAVGGERIAGTLRLPAGRAVVVARDSAGREVAGPAFRVAEPGGAFVEILRPAEDPVFLVASGVWLEVRGGAPEGLRELEWETGDGRSGTLGRVIGARDSTVSAIAPLAAGSNPGDTVRYRVVAHPAVGAPAASAWRTAIVADQAALRAEFAAARADAARGVERAVTEARGLAAENGTPPDGEERAAAEAVDRQLQAAADSLAATLDRTLADPGLRPGLAARLEGYRRLLEGVARAQLAARPGLLGDPAAAANARASVLEAIREKLAEVEALAALSAAADTLSRLADVESALAARTRLAEPGDLAARIGPLQADVGQAARGAVGPLPDSLAGAVEAALQAAETTLAGRVPEAAAEAQEAAAGVLSGAAAEARREVDEAERHAAGQLAAMDRAGAETLFLAERQRELAERMATVRTGAADHAERVARQRVVARGLESTLGALVEAIGGRPAGFELAARLAQAVFATRYAEEAVAQPPGRGNRGVDPRAAADDAARALALLSRAFLLPDDDGGGGGAGAAGQGRSGAAARELDAMAGAERAIADAMAMAEPAGGNAEAAAAQRGIGRRFGDVAEELEALGVDPRTVGALREAVDRTASRLERGLPGAETESDLRALARRFADLGRIIEQSPVERRRSKTANTFLPADPPPLPKRLTAPRLDPVAALRPWEKALPRAAIGTARHYLERLAEAGVRVPGDPR